MAKYTVELNDIQLEFSGAMVTYPIFDAVHRSPLNTLIFNHYRFREIGMETPARFAHHLSSAMCEIMPYYN
jgi:hypothetical protein